MFDWINFQAIAEAAKDHYWVPLAWLLLTAVVNSIAHFFTPRSLDDWAESHPVLAKLANAMRRLGIEPIALIQSIMDFFSKNPPPPSAGTKAQAQMGSGSTPDFTSKGSYRKGALVVAVCALAGCTPAQAANDMKVALEVKDIVCIDGVEVAALIAGKDSPAAADVQKACSIADSMLPLVDDAIKVWQAADTTKALKMKLSASKHAWGSREAPKWLGLTSECRDIAGGTCNGLAAAY